MTRNGTDPDTNICHWFLIRANWRDSLRVDERMAAAGSGKFKRNTKLSIYTLEKNGHLQLRLSDELLSVRSGG